MNIFSYYITTHFISSNKDYNSYCNPHSIYQTFRNFTCEQFWWWLADSSWSSLFFFSFFFFDKVVFIYQKKKKNSLPLSINSPSTSSRVHPTICSLAPLTVLALWHLPILWLHLLPYWHHAHLPLPMGTNN